MQQRNYKTILYFISIVILATLAIQVYWNYKNYEAGKAQLVRDVQTSVDNAVSTYYENLASQNTLGFLGSGDHGDAFFTSDQFKNFTNSIDSGSLTINDVIISDIEKDGFLTIHGANPSEVDSILKEQISYSQEIQREATKDNSSTSWRVFGDNKRAVDSISDRIKKNLGFRTSDTLTNNDSLDVKFPERFNALSKLTTQVVLSFKDDSIDIDILDSLVLGELGRKDISRINHSLSYAPKGDFSKLKKKNYDFEVSSASVLLPEKSKLTIGFDNAASIILKRNLFGVFLSILLVSAVIASLLYLLKIIQEQKQLAEIKNDFISNITHEFKTPIATIGVAMESIQHFNNSNDVEKTKKYVNMSSQQVAKLNTMVEKLLETATLDSDALMLNKQETNMVQLLEHVTQSHQETLDGKILSLEVDSENSYASVDVFHLENALDNIVDNAIKYGGDHINISLHKTASSLVIKITDGGNGLTKSQTQQIFEKFYRIPKGNTHDIKGFGIGLYYTKTIIEKHGGSIVVQTQPTTFKITLPYV